MEEGIDEEISNAKLMTMWQTYQLEKMRDMASGKAPVENPFESMTAEKLGLMTTEVTPYYLYGVNHSEIPSFF